MAKKNTWKYPVLIGSGIVLAALILSLSPLAPPVLKDYVQGAIGKRDVYRDSSSTSTSGAADVSASNAQFAQIYAMGQFRSLANNADFQALLNSADFQSMITQQGFQQMLGNGQFQQLMMQAAATGSTRQQSGATGALVGSHDTGSAATAGHVLASNGTGSAATGARLESSKLESQVTALATQMNLGNVATNAHFLALVQDKNFEALVQSADFRALVQNQAFQAAAATQNFANATQSELASHVRF